MSVKASDAWKSLKGLLCVYKPPGTSWKYVRNKLKQNISRDLGNLEIPPRRKYLEINRSNSEISVNVRPCYADNVLCSGPKYPPEVILIDTPIPLGDLASGVLIFNVNDSNFLLKAIKNLNFTKCYRLKGILGQATASFHIDDRVIGKAKYQHVKKSTMDRYISNYQSTAHRRIFEEYGVPMHSQEGYNFAVKGLYRPVFKGAPIVYSMEIIDFEPPKFTLEVQCIFETDTFLLSLIHNLGLGLKSYATCTDIRCIRTGCFHTEHALVKNQWNLKEILENVQTNWDVFSKQYPKKVKHEFSVKSEKNFDKEDLFKPKGLISSS